jgi:hypothetical protein
MAGWMGWVGWGGTGTGTGRESIVMFIVFMVFVQLVLLNMLIAIMGDSVQTVNAQKSAAGLHAKCELIMDCWCERDKRIHIDILLRHSIPRRIIIHQDRLGTNIDRERAPKRERERERSMI